MARDDYHVIAYRILAYLYACLKSGEMPNLDYIRHNADAINIPLPYWKYIIRHLHESGYVEGVILIPIMRQSEKDIKLSPSFTITPKGIEFLEENSAMNKAKNFLKTLKDTIPGL